MKEILKNRKGETLVETLASLAIACIAILILFNGINSAKTQIEKTDKTMSDYYDRNNEIFKGESEVDSTGTVSFSKAIIPGEKDIKVNFYINSVYKANPVMVYVRDINE